ncbi:MAG TPA: hypothetical protein VHD36_09150 [Pirellulales bacterium]|nr:hypothetical protein [Pirellulales bacterium]
MFNRGYTIAIFAFWLATSGWLVKEKLLPPLIVGDPPTYGTILAADPEDQSVAWEILLNGRSLGGAVTTTEHLADGISQLRCRVSLQELPLSELTPAWLTAFVKVLDTSRRDGEAIIAVESETIIDIDPLNRPLNFSSVTKIGPPEQGSGRRSFMSGVEFNVVMRGKIVGDLMQVAIRAGELEYHTEINLPADALIGDVLSPQTRLPGLRVGQTWTVPIFSPFRPPNSPVEVLHATVERKDPILWHDRIVPALLVVYRGDPGRGLSSDQGARAQMWVDYEGEVVKQEIHLLSSRMTFVRVHPDEPAAWNLLPDTSEPLRVPPAAMDESPVEDVPKDASAADAPPADDAEPSTNTAPGAQAAPEGAP